MKKKLLILMIALLIFSPFLRVVYKNRSKYATPFDLQLMKMFYESSVYVKEKGGAWIADELLFAYTSWYYINGGSPILVNPENPPLGKYIVGLSIKLFNNEKFPSLVFGFLSLFSFFLLCRLFLKSNLLALLPVAFFSWERLTWEQLIFLPLFETFALTFLCFSFYFFIKAQDKKGYFLLSNFFLGALWATRPWMATVPLIMALVVYLLLVQKNLKQSLLWLITTPMAPVVLLLSYSKLFLEGWSPYKVLSVQKWILWYHQSRLIKIGTVWPLIYLNRWYVWWGDKPYLRMVQWNIFWPIITTVALIFSILVLLKTFGLKIKWFKNFKFDKKITVLCLWVIFYLAFLSIGNINSRYLFYLLPFCYLLGVYGIFKFRGQVDRNLTRVKLILSSGKPRLVWKLFKIKIGLMFGITPLFRHVEIVNTLDCNLNCKHCSAKTLKKNQKQLLTLEDYRKIGEECKKYNVSVVSFTGGEPFCNPRLEEIIKCFNPRETLIGITTNGTLANEKKLRRLKKIGLDSLLVSIDSSDPATHDAFRNKKGVFRSAMQTIKTARKLGIETIIITTVHHDNIRKKNGLIGMIKLAEKLGVLLHVSLAAPVGKWASEESCRQFLLTKDDQKYLRQLRKKHLFIRRDFDSNFILNGCPAGTERFVILPNGEVLVCTKIHVSFGNIRKDSMLTIRKRMLKHKVFRETLPFCLCAESTKFINQYMKNCFGKSNLPLKEEDFFNV